MNDENELNPPVMDGYIKIPTFKLWVANRFPYIETDFDGITTYELMEALTNYLNNVIQNEEKVEKNLSSLYDFCVLLNNKINQIYNNIDNIVENEIENILNQMVEDGIFDDIINNKLDQMVEDGIFDDILTRLIPQNILQKFDTLQDLKNANLNVGDIALTLGYYSKFDGGKALYKVTDNTSIDNIFTYSMQNGNTIELLDKNNFNILQIGAKRNDNTFDNKPILKTIFSDGLNDTNVYIPEGVYYTTPVNYVGQNNETNNVKILGIGKPTIKLLHNNAVKTTVGTYNSNYYVSDNIGTLDLGNDCQIVIINLENNKKYYYLKVADKTRIPASLTKNMILEGVDTHTKAVIASIDRDDPDGENTARIYLFETYNDISRILGFKNTNNILGELFKIKESLYNEYLYIRFADNIVPSYFANNLQIEQISTGKKARIDNINITFGETNFVRLNCFEQEDIFSLPQLYLDDNIPFNINRYTTISSGVFSLNRFKNVIIENIIFDGNNLDISNYQNNGNDWNIIISGACKNLAINNCIFKNSVQAGIQIGGMTNAYATDSHDYPENVVLTNCYFSNNGRGDIEVIYGHNITFNNCVGDGTLDIETNGNEMTNNININNCQFQTFTPYTPAVVSASSFINVSNSKFFTVVAQGRICLNLSNVMIHQLQPQLCTIDGTNCSINLLNGLHGNENMHFTNSMFLSTYQGIPGSQNMQTKLHLVNCLIDLSLTTENKLDSIKNVNLDNCIMLSQTKRKLITENKVAFSVNNSTFQNVGIDCYSANASSVETSIFTNCNFKSFEESKSYVIRGSINAIIKNCIIETNITITYGSLYIIDSVISTVTKPTFLAYYNSIVNGLKTQDGSGINWNWIQTPDGSHKVKFVDVEFKDTFTSSTLGVFTGLAPLGINSVSDECRGYYVGNSDKAFVKLYYNDNAIAKKEISFT